MSCLTAFIQYQLISQEQFQIEVTKSLSAMWADIHANASMGRKFTIRREVAPPSRGIVLESTDGSCIDRLGKPVDRPQRTIVNLECNMEFRSKPDEDKGIFYVNNSKLLLQYMASKTETAPKTEVFIKTRILTSR